MGSCQRQGCACPLHQVLTHHTHPVQSLLPLFPQSRGSCDGLRGVKELLGEADGAEGA